MTATMTRTGHHSRTCVRRRPLPRPQAMAAATVWYIRTAP